MKVSLEVIILTINLIFSIHTWRLEYFVCYAFFFVLIIKTEKFHLNFEDIIKLILFTKYELNIFKFDSDSNTV